MTSKLGWLLGILTVFFVIIGTLWPAKTAPIVGEASGTISLPGSSATAQGAVNKLFDAVEKRDWNSAYAQLANASELDKNDFIQDLSGTNGSLRTYSYLESFETHMLHAGDADAMVRANLQWSTVVGAFHDVHDLRVLKQQEGWRVVWPAPKETKVPPQVIPVDYLRWDVIYRGAADDWGTQDVESPHVRIVAMNPVSRGGGVTILGEILNEDTVPAFVSVSAALVAKDGSEIAQESSFDKISHTILPKQVSPFRIDFPGVSLSEVDSVQMKPFSTLVSASADPVIAVDDQHLGRDAHGVDALTGTLMNQSGQVVNIAHVLATFYDHTGQIVWVADDYAPNALQPQTPENFAVNVPEDLASKVATYRVVVSPYSANRFR